MPGVTLTQNDSPIFIESVGDTSKKARRQVAFAAQLAQDFPTPDKFRFDDSDRGLIRSALKGSFKRSERDPSFGVKTVEEEGEGRDSYLKWKNEVGRIDQIAFGIDFL